MYKVKRFINWLIYDYLKLFYKETKFYYTNNINDNLGKHKNVGAGKSFLFSNRMGEIYAIQQRLEISGKHLRVVNGFPCLEIIGAKKGHVRLMENSYNMTMAGILKELKNQKSDKI